MPELDYAMLAEYAGIAEGKLTVVGASYTHLTVPDLTRMHLLAVAGRVRVPEGAEGPELGIEIKSPHDEYVIKSEADLTPGPSSRPYNGKVGIIFALTTVMPLPSTGLYVVNVLLDGDQVRRLAFDVEVAAER